MSVTSPSETRWRYIVLLARPQFLVPGLLLYILGFLLAAVHGANLDQGQFIWGYAIFFFAHFSLTFSNDYFDQEADSYKTPTPLSGGSGVLRWPGRLSGPPGC
jgi:1,4-dihydroxy-2-naphthoate octaprenyltransferase